MESGGVSNEGYVHDTKTEQPRAEKNGHSTVNTATDDNEDDTVDLSCGIWKFRTNILGRCYANLYLFAIFCGVSTLFNQMSRTIVNTQLVYLQRQFNVDKANVALLETASRIGVLLTILIPGHFGKRAHIPFIVGLSGVLQGLALIVPAVLQLVKPYQLPTLDQGNSSTHGDNAQYLCMAEHGNDTHLPGGGSHAGEEPPDHMAFTVLLVVQVVRGLMEPFHTGVMPMVYLDDNTMDKTKMGVFIGIVSIIGDLAQPLGKQVNSILTEIPIDLSDTAMDPKDPRFVAAWWLAFLVFGAGTAIFSLPIIFFPKKLVSRKQQVEALRKAAKTFSGLEESAPGDGGMEGGVGERKKSGLNAELQLEDLNSRRRSLIIGPGIDLQHPGSDRRLSVTMVISEKRPSQTLSLKSITARRVSVTGDVLMAEEKEEDHRLQSQDNSETLGKAGFKKLLIDFPKALWRLAHVPIFVMIIIDIIIVSIPFTGIGFFRTVYAANEYNVPMAEAAMLSGYVQAVGNIAGTLLSAWISTRVRTKAGYIWIIFATYAVVTCVVPAYLYLDCPNYPVYGHEGELGLPANMTDMCGCETEKQLLSCGSDGLHYYSPCHAGCTSLDGKTFMECTGLATGNGTVTPGLCDTTCHDNFVIYTVLNGVQGLVFTMAMVPRRLLLFRVVSAQDRGFAGSMLFFFFDFLAIPSANLFGSVIDDACLVKDKNVCNLYDRTKIRYLMGGVDTGVHGVLAVTVIIMIVMNRVQENRDRREAKQKSVEMERKDDVVVKL